MERNLSDSSLEKKIHILSKKNPHKILEHKLEFTNSLIIKIHKEQAMEQREKCFEDAKEMTWH